jgi:F-type H+-transporting ATPase subunit delta
VIEEFLWAKYARAIFDLAKENNKFEEFQVQLDFFANILRRQKEIIMIFEHPAITRQQKEELLAMLLAGGWFSPQIKVLIQMLVKRRRVRFIKDIAKIYQDLSLFMERKVRIYIEAACGLSQRQMSALEQVLSEMLSRKVELKVTRNPSLLAGLKVKVGSRLYDYSAKRNLECLSKSGVIGCI